MTQLENRAEELLDALHDCGLGGGLTEDDILGSGAREPFRSCCISIADRIWALYSSPSSSSDKTTTTTSLAPLLQPVLSSLRLCANTEATSTQNGQLDSLLLHIAHILDPDFSRTTVLDTSSKSTARLQSLEVVVPAIQAATMITMRNTTTTAQIPPSSSGGREDGDMEVEYDPGSIAVSSALRDLAALLNVDEDVILTGCGTTGTPGTTGTTGGGGGGSDPPPSSSSAASIVASIKEATQETVKSLPSGIFAPLLPPGSLNDAQLAMLQEVDAAFKTEYSLRRKMLIERARVTLQSLLSSKRLDKDGGGGELRAAAEAAAQAADARMEVQPKVALDDCFAVTISDLLPIMEKATSGSGGVRGRMVAGSNRRGGGSAVHASVKNVIIGAVPDRGGRTEGRGRVADMPAWSARRAGRRSGGGGGGGGGGRRGGRGGGGGVHSNNKRGGKGANKKTPY